MKEIWKFEIPIEGNFELSMPLGSEIIAFQTQYENPCIWAIVNPSSKLVLRTFSIKGTGHQFEDPGKYIGTIQQINGTLVWHLFEIT